MHIHLRFKTTCHPWLNLLYIDFQSYEICYSTDLSGVYTDLDRQLMKSYLSWRKSIRIYNFLMNKPWVPLMSNLFREVLSSVYLVPTTLGRALCWMPYWEESEYYIYWLPFCTYHQQFLIWGWLSLEVYNWTVVLDNWTTGVTLILQFCEFKNLI